MKGFRLSIFALLLASTGTVVAQGVPITVTEVKKEIMSSAIPAAGTVFSRSETQITAGIAGRLEWVAEPGEFVEANGAVAVFDCEPLELRLLEQQTLAEREQINVDILGRELERLQALRASMAVSATQLDRVQADRDLAANALQTSRIRIRQIQTESARCIATAPFSGVVTERLRHGGEDVDRNTVLARMTDTRNLEVRASIPIHHLPRVSPGTMVDVRLSGVELEGQLRTIVPAGDPLSQTFEVRVNLPAGSQHLVTAGQLVSVSLPLSTDKALTVPRDSIVLRQDGTFVMRITHDDVVEQVSIEVQEAFEERVSVRGELSPGDRIAVRGAEALDDGEAVIIQTAGP